MNLEEDIKKYIASFDDVLTLCGDNLFLAQQHFYKQNPSPELSFNAFVFFASNMKSIINNNATITLHKRTKTKVPKKVVVRCGDANYSVIVRGETSEDILTDLFINARLVDIKYPRDSFPAKAYYSQHYEMIELFFFMYPNRKSDSDLVNSSRFYIEYGFWNNIELNHINGYRYIASIPEFIEGFPLDIKHENVDYALNHYFQNEPKLTFSPSLYVVSNWSKLSEFRNESTRCINPDRVSMHYITKGYQDKMPTRSFDHWKYLADNTDYITELLKSKDGVISWDLIKLTPTRTANLFIKNNGQTKNDFNAEEFVKLYVADTEVNYDKRMYLENAAQYFVKGYVMNSTIRWRTTLGYFSLEFLRNRMHDMIRQMPLHILRCIFFPKI
jgi:hypothetical protein